MPKRYGSMSGLVLLTGAIAFAAHPGALLGCGDDCEDEPVEEAAARAETERVLTSYVIRDGEDRVELTLDELTYTSAQQEREVSALSWSVIEPAYAACGPPGRYLDAAALVTITHTVGDAAPVTVVENLPVQGEFGAYGTGFIEDWDLILSNPEQKLYVNIVEGKVTISALEYEGEETEQGTPTWSGSSADRTLGEGSSATD